MGNQKIKTKVMNKQDPKFIKDRMVEYVNKVSHHYYQHSKEAEKPGNKVIFVPFIKDSEAIMFKIEINAEDKVVMVDHERCSSKRCFKGQLFHIWRSPYQTLTSIKKYKRYVEIEDKAKDFIENNKDLINEKFNDYTGRRNFCLGLGSHLKK
jgi:hypothetical protein